MPDAASSTSLELNTHGRSALRHGSLPLIPYPMAEVHRIAWSDCFGAVQGDNGSWESSKGLGQIGNVGGCSLQVAASSRYR